MFQKIPIKFEKKKNSNPEPHLVYMLFVCKYKLYTGILFLQSEKLNLQKKIQELEGKLSLHNQFQEDLLGQVSEVRNAAKSIVEESQRLATIQKNVLENGQSSRV